MADSNLAQISNILGFDFENIRLQNSICENDEVTKGVRPVWSSGYRARL